MNCKERMTRAMRYESPDTVPAAPYLIGKYAEKLMAERKERVPSLEPDFIQTAADAYMRHGCDWMLLFFDEENPPHEIIDAHRDDRFLARGFSAPYARRKRGMSSGETRAPSRPSL